MKFRLVFARTHNQNYLLNKSLRNYSKSPKLYVLSAVRTPIGLYKGVLSDFTAPQLISFAFKEALQRAVVSSEDIQNVFLGCFSNDNNRKEIIQRTGLSNTVKISDSVSGMESFIKGSEFLSNSDLTLCMTGGMVSMSNHIQNEEFKINTLKEILQQREMKDMKTDYNNLINSFKKEAFQDEIAKIMFRKKGKRIIVTEDELSEKIINFNNKVDLENSLTFADGAVAFLIASENYVNINQLKPIAKIISFAQESVNFNNMSSAIISVIEKALKIGKCNENEISRWEIDSIFHDFYKNFEKHFNVNSNHVNKDGGVVSLGYPIGLSGSISLCHLSHCLKFEEFGCCVSFDVTGAASAVVLKKFRSKLSTPPKLTLFTKNVCPLCDSLKDQLKPFEGRFSLQEINIEAEENKKYKDLYEYEIPVLFLEGKFLCKHSLNAEHFNRRLLDLDNCS